MSEKISPMRKLREKYGKSKAREALNAAIRAEIPGGDLVLDRLTAAYQMTKRCGQFDADGDETIACTCWRWLTEIADEMEAAIRDQYGLDPAPERDDLNRGGHHGSNRRRK